LESKRKKILRKLQLPLRLVIINDETFEEKFSFKLTPMNVFVGLSSFIVLFGLGIILLVYSTPFRELLPGYGDSDTKRNLQELMYKTDSIEKTLLDNEQFLKNKIDVLNGGSGLSDSIK
jgi:hypothetical protein